MAVKRRHLPMTRDEERQLIDEERATFANTVFGLRAFPGREFQVHPSQMAHFVSEIEGVQLVVNVRVLGTDRWEQFGRFTPADIRAQVTWHRKEAQ